MALAIIRQPKRVVPVQRASSTRSTWRKQPTKIPHILRPSDKQVPEIRLNEEQQATYEEILRHIHGGRPGVTLLQGVTGSGKTEVYICLARRLLEEGKRAMILVPEIALTPQMMQRFSMYFGEDVALLHSALGIAERRFRERIIWKRRIEPSGNCRPSESLL